MFKSLVFIFLLSVLSFSGEYHLDSTNRCFGFDRVSVDTQDGSCVGLILDGGEGLKKPRKVIQLSSKVFYITDMVNWSANNGILWEVTIDGARKKLRKVFSKLDRPHGLRKGPDGLIYVGEASQIIRFNPSSPSSTKEVVIKDLPTKGSHPLSEFIFTSDNRLILNIGAPSDQCLKDGKKAVYPCEATKSEAVLREYRMSESGDFTFSKNLAFGLRNSMGLVEIESGEIIQFNNGMDFNDESTPLEEINLIGEGQNYGWPYCYGSSKLNKSYKRSFFNRRIPKIDCSIYESPIGYLPAHSAPLDAILYDSEMFPEFKGKILVSLHGYRKSGQRIVALELNTSKRNNTSFQEVVYGWTAKEGIRPKGAPVGLDIGLNGEVYFIDDKNKTLMVLAKGESNPSVETDPDVRSDEVRLLKLDQFKLIQKSIISKHCIQCHTEYDSTAESVANYMLDSGSVIPGNAEDSDIFQRLSGVGSNRMMPPTGIKLSPESLSLVKNWINSISVE